MQYYMSVTQPFYLGVYEVTQAQRETIMDGNPSRFKGRTNPVGMVSWHEAKEFSRRLNEKKGHASYRLPTETEWEYTARAGTDTDYSFGNNPDQLEDYAWYVIIPRPRPTLWV